MSEPTENEQRAVAPGIAKAMSDVRRAGHLSDRHRHRWNLPSDREEPAEGSAGDEQVK